jgi:hypothetical protein
MDIAELKKELIGKIMTSNDLVLMLQLNLLLLEKENDIKILNEPLSTYEKIRVFSAE